MTLFSYVCTKWTDYTLLKLIKTYDATYRQCGGKFVITVMCIDCSFSLSMRIVLYVRENVVCLGAEQQSCSIKSYHLAQQCWANINSIFLLSHSLAHTHIFAQTSDCVYKFLFQFRNPYNSIKLYLAYFVGFAVNS